MTWTLQSDHPRTGNRQLMQSSLSIAFLAGRHLTFMRTSDPVQVATKKECVAFKIPVHDAKVEQFKLYSRLGLPIL